MINEPCQPKVTQFGLKCRVKHHITRFDVSMYHALVPFFMKTEQTRSQTKNNLAPNWTWQDLFLTTLIMKEKYVIKSVTSPVRESQRRTGWRYTARLELEVMFPSSSFFLDWRTHHLGIQSNLGCSGRTRRSWNWVELQREVESTTRREILSCEVPLIEL